MLLPRKISIYLYVWLDFILFDFDDAQLFVQNGRTRTDDASVLAAGVLSALLSIEEIDCKTNFKSTVKRYENGKLLITIT